MLKSKKGSKASPKGVLISDISFICFFVVPGISVASSVLESDGVINLPNQTQTPWISQFAGYITVNEEHGRALFYWFFEAQSEPSQKPLLLWLNGGPGCSSIAYGAASELGPLRVGKNGVDLEFNQFAWNQEANLLFVESPIGVGFSYTNTSSDLTKLDDAFVAEDAYNFLVKWLQRYPQFKSRDFFISGESYAGHYVPQLAELVYDRNNDRSRYPFINLKGFMVENPVTDDNYDYTGIMDYAWSHSVIPDDLYRKSKQVCDFKALILSTECNDVVNQVFDKYSEIDIYNIYAPKCLFNTTSSSTANKKTNHGLKRVRILAGGHDPCYSEYAEMYFNRPDVQKSIHADARGVKWESCKDSILNTYNFSVFSVLPTYKKLIKANLKIWMYRTGPVSEPVMLPVHWFNRSNRGDMDGRIPVISSRYCVEALGLPLKSPWRSWFHDQQVGGRMVVCEGLTLVTVRGAGHLVPRNKPSQALASSILSCW
ncbi:Serine carboxypeptidase-like 33 [Hibiscus syriacus]|uniref:Carboxypeptidase n=1 Tax=Hibiscus syriacus TaxID=106335 RepID=A0A6A2ZHL3_HIBSY|nr:Serine carboxypeptidase-like 33 [Hibiscus syriacus]